MSRREEIGRQRWSAIVRQVRAGLHDDLLPLYDSRGEIGIALWSQAYAHLCRFPGLAEEAPNHSSRRRLSIAYKPKHKTNEQKYS